jgi:DNA-binding transcriptional MerR regulator
MKIGELADRTGVPQRMLRYYEQQGLLSPQRSDNGYRSYRDADVDRVQRVRSLIRSGMPTRLIRVVLEMEDETWTEQCTRDFAETLAEELRAIEDKIACLSLSRDTVRDYLTRTRYAALVEG